MSAPAVPVLDPAATPNVNVAVQGPYEAAIIAGFSLLEKIIDGQPPDVKKQLWENYIAFVQPFHDLNVALNNKIITAVEGLFRVKSS